MRPFSAVAIGVAIIGAAVAVWRLRPPEVKPVTVRPELPRSVETWAQPPSAVPSRAGEQPVLLAAELPRHALGSDELRQRLAANHARSNADRAGLRDILEQASRKFDGPERDGLIQDIGTQVAGLNPEWGHSLAAGLEDLRSRQLFTRAMVEAIGVNNPNAAVAWIAEGDEPALRDAACNVLAMKWAAADLDATKAWALGLTDASMRASAVDGMTWTWAQKDPNSVYDWAVGLSDAGLREQVFVKTAKMLAVQNPRQALEWALQFPGGTQRDQALHYAVFQWAAQDLNAATDWAASVTDAGLRTNSEVAIARSWSAQEAQGATAWAATINDPAAHALALKTTLRKWAEASPADAAAWISQRGATPTNEEIFRSVTASLADASSVTTSAWLQSVTNPDWRRIGEQILTAAQAQARAKRPPTG